MEILRERRGREKKEGTTENVKEGASAL